MLIRPSATEYWNSLPQPQLNGAGGTLRPPTPTVRVAPQEQLMVAVVSVVVLLTRVISGPATVVN